MYNESYQCGKAIVNKNEFLNQYCTPAQKEFLGSHSMCFVYKKEQIIFHENSPAPSVYFVSSGKAALWKKGIHTHMQIIRFAKEGDILGYRGCVIGNDRYQLSASTMEDSLICSIDKNVFSQVLNENRKLNLSILMFYTKELEKTETRMRNLAEMNVREKIADALLTVFNTFGTNGNNTLNLALSRECIAAIAGISTDRVIKQLAEFRKENIVSSCGKHIVLKKTNKLIEIVERFT